MKRFPLIVLILVCVLSIAFVTGQIECQPLSWKYNAPSSVYSVAVSADGNYMIGGCKDGGILFFDRELTNGKELWKSTGVLSIATVAISNDGGYAVAGSDDAVVYFFDRGFSDSKTLWKYGVKGPAK